MGQRGVGLAIVAQQHPGHVRTGRVDHHGEVLGVGRIDAHVVQEIAVGIHPLDGPGVGLDHVVAPLGRKADVTTYAGFVYVNARIGKGIAAEAYVGGQTKAAHRPVGQAVGQRRGVETGVGRIIRIRRQGANVIFTGLRHVDLSVGAALNGPVVVARRAVDQHHRNVLPLVERPLHGGSVDAVVGRHVEHGVARRISCHLDAVGLSLSGEVNGHRFADLQGFGIEVEHLYAIV